MTQDKHNNSKSDHAQSQSDDQRQQKQAAGKQAETGPPGSSEKSLHKRETSSATGHGQSEKTTQANRDQAEQGQAQAADSKKAADKTASSAEPPAKRDDKAKNTAPTASKTASKSTSTDKKTAASGAETAARNSTGGTGKTPPGTGAKKQNGKKGAYPLSLIVAVAALVIAVIAILFSVFVGYQGRQQLKDLNSQVASFSEGHESDLSSVRDQASDLDSRTDDLSDTVGQTQDDMSDLKSQVEHLQVQQRQLSDQLGGNHERFVEQRIELLLEAANQQIQIAADPKAASRALKLADSAIKNSGNPELHSVRDRIADELGDLKALPHPDIDGLALKLAKTIRQVPDLPLKSNVPSSYEADEAKQEHDSAKASDDDDNDEAQSKTGQLKAKWRQLTDSVRTGLAQMITVRRANGTADEPALMAPDQSYFLVENIQLQLRTARLALINSNEQTYQDALNEARDWIKQYFDQKSSRVTGLLSDLSDLADVELAWQAPDLSGSLKELRRIMARNEAMDSAGTDDQAEDDTDSQSSSTDEHQDTSSDDDSAGDEAGDAAEQDDSPDESESSEADEQDDDDTEDSQGEDEADEQDQDSDAEQADGRT